MKYWKDIGSVLELDGKWLLFTCVDYSKQTATVMFFDSMKELEKWVEAEGKIISTNSK